MRVAMKQASPGASVGQNLDRLKASLEDAAAGDAHVLVTPEMYLTGYNIGPAKCRELAEPIDGPLVSQVSELAADSGVAVLVGFPELGEDEHVYNALALVDSRGAVISTYRKTHLFGDLDHAQFSPGAGFPDPVLLAGANVGLAICYDIEFPEVARLLAMSGADVVLVPTANWLDTVNTRIVPVRAQENSIAVVYVNFVGAEGALKYCGRSVAAGASGEIIAEVAAGESLTFADVDPSATVELRARIDYLADRRTDLY